MPLQITNGVGKVGVRRSTPVPQIVTSGLTLHLDAGNPLSYPGTGTLWTDLSGQANNGTLTNGPTFNSSNGGSVVLDGVNDYVSTSLTANYQRLTLASWVYCNPNTSMQTQEIISKRYYWAYMQTDWPTALSINAAATSANFFVSSGYRYDFTNGNGASVSGVIQPNTWNYIVGVYNGSQVRIYINGVLSQSVSFSGVVSQPNTTWKIGKSSVDWSGGVGLSYLKGRIGSATIYSRGLSDSEILQNYNALKGRYGL